jgi:hypothetical protein
MRVHAEDSPASFPRYQGCWQKQYLDRSVIQKNSRARSCRRDHEHRARESGILASIEEMRTYSFIETIT